MQDRLATSHLELILGALNRACAEAVHRQQAEASFLDRDELAGWCITDREVAMLLDRVASGLTGPSVPAGPDGPVALLTEAERRVEADLRHRAAQVGAALPLDGLARAGGLGYSDLLALVAVAGPELDRAYQRIYAYLADDLERRHATVDTLLCLTAGLGDRHELRRSFGPYGPLRRLGLVRAERRSTTDLDSALGLGDGVLEILLGASVDVGLLGDLANEPAGFPGEPGSASAVPATAPYPLDVLAGALEADLVDTVGLWAGTDEEADDAARALARLTGRPLVPVEVGPGGVVADPIGIDGPGADPGVGFASLEAAVVRSRALTAAASGGILWIRLGGGAAPGPDDERLVTRMLACSHLPTVVSGPAPWRPAGALAGRSMAEVTVVPVDAPDREALLAAEVPGLGPAAVRGLVRRWPLGRAGTRAAGAMARTASTLATGEATPSAEAVERSCALLSAVSSGHLLTAVEPRRGTDLLVLPDAVHCQVTELASFARAARAVTADWGFGRILTGGGGVKALFVGEPGTGKTLAAEVIAHSLGVQLLKVDLAQLVSKWVGETAKHLDLVFRSAASGSGVLFFDEADALFGKRGEVRHGTDRYANTEVSHLLQRFEQHDGIVILASNLRDNIDPAFARRFDAIVTFPRPGLAERRRLWALAFPAPAPTEADVDLDLVAGLDMTGAAIVSAARLAALLAAGRGEGGITMADVVHGIVRVHHTEGRLLSPADLGPYADLVRDGAVAAGPAPLVRAWA